MIVRKIIHDPIAGMACFDWFNDYADTRSWLVSHGPNDVLQLLDAAYAVWRRKRRESQKADS